MEKYPDAFRVVDNYISENRIGRLGALVLRGSLHVKLQKMEAEMETAKRGGYYEQWKKDNPI